MSLIAKRFNIDRHTRSLDTLQTFLRQEGLSSSQIVVARTVQVAPGTAVLLLVYEDVPETEVTSTEIVATCDESLLARDWVAVGATDDTVVLADASAMATEAIGIISSKPSTTTAKVMVAGELGGFTGLTVRDQLFLSTTPGDHVIGQNFDPVPYGYGIVQKLGIATSSTSIVVDLGPAIEIE